MVHYNTHENLNTHHIIHCYIHVSTKSATGSAITHNCFWYKHVRYLPSCVRIVRIMNTNIAHNLNKNEKLEHHFLHIDCNPSWKPCLNVVFYQYTRCTLCKTDNTKATNLLPSGNPVPRALSPSHTISIVKSSHLPIWNPTIRKAFNLSYGFSDAINPNY